MSSYHGIGLMSGTSLDGLDICYVEFTGDIDTDIWGYRIIRANTVKYTPEWTERLCNAQKLSGLELIRLHTEYGHLVGQELEKFMADEKTKVHFVASHGHTVFHQPDKNVTFQIGDGETTSGYLACPYVCDFRTKDVSLGGQGAPLVPMGERYLFSTTDICVNLGGIANISFRGRSAYDICACNSIMNWLASQHNPTLSHDVDGRIAAQGHVIDSLLHELEALPHYSKPPPKSLSLEWMLETIYPLLDVKAHSIPDLLRTYVEHVSNRIAEACLAARKYPRLCAPRRASQLGPFTVLVTGGGAFNKYLMGLLKTKLRSENVEITEADDDTINFKEALVFAFLGLRCLLGLQNVWGDVTGSGVDTCSGSIHLPPAIASGSPTSHGKSRFAFRFQRSESVSSQ